MQGILFIGPQASGKSTFYQLHFFKTHIRINLDMLKTRHKEHIIFQACITAKQALVIDNTNPLPETRAGYIASLKAAKFKVIGYYFNSTLEECLQRNQFREGKEKIPEVGIKATYKKLIKPCYKEGFNTLYQVTLIENYFKIELIEP